jgi:hypothetical protein
MQNSEFAGAVISPCVRIFLEMLYAEANEIAPVHSPVLFSSPRGTAQPHQQPSSATELK